jgi:hypothetical protein
LRDLDKVSLRLNLKHYSKETKTLSWVGAESLHYSGIGKKAQKFAFIVARGIVSY